jgi:hypothetical protein
VEGIDAENALKAKVMKQPYESLFAGDWTLKNPLNAPETGQTTIPRDRFRWSVWAKGLSGERWSASCATRSFRSSPRWVSGPPITSWMAPD